VTAAQRKARGGAAFRAAVAVVALLSALGLVIWRQGRALQALAELDAAKRDRALLVAERADLERKIQVLESRAHVLPEARERLGMRTPEAAEMVILPGETP
jgi:cell division protein FtsL